MKTVGVTHITQTNHPLSVADGRTDINVYWTMINVFEIILCMYLKKISPMCPEWEELHLHVLFITDQYKQKVLGRLYWSINAVIAGYKIQRRFRQKQIDIIVLCKQRHGLFVRMTTWIVEIIIPALPTAKADLATGSGCQTCFRSKRLFTI